MIPYIFLPILYYLGSIDLWAIIKPQYYVSIPEPLTLSATGFSNNYTYIPPASGVHFTTDPVPVAPASGVNSTTPQLPHPHPPLPQPQPQPESRGWQPRGWRSWAEHPWAGQPWPGTTPQDPPQPQPQPQPQPEPQSQPRGWLSRLVPLAPRPPQAAGTTVPVNTQPVAVPGLVPVTPHNVMESALNIDKGLDGVIIRKYYKTPYGMFKPYFLGQCHDRQVIVYFYDRERLID